MSRATISPFFAIMRRTRIACGPACRTGCLADRSAAAGHLVTFSWLGRTRTGTCRPARALAATAARVAVLASVPAAIGGAAAQGETRALSFYHTHTSESATITFR